MVDLPALTPVGEPAPPDLDVYRPGLPLVERQSGARIGATSQLHQPNRTPGRARCTRASLRRHRRRWCRGVGCCCGRYGRPVEPLGSHESLVRSKCFPAGLVKRLTSTLMASGSGQRSTGLQHGPGGSALASPVPASPLRVRHGHQVMSPQSSRGGQQQTSQEARLMAVEGNN